MNWPLQNRTAADEAEGCAGLLLLLLLLLACVGGWLLSAGREEACWYDRDPDGACAS